jgi:hypothetical protein
MSWYRRLLDQLNISKPETREPHRSPSTRPIGNTASRPQTSIPLTPASIPVEPIPIQPAAHDSGSPASSGLARIDQIRKKIQKLAEQFAGGLINRGQFEELFAHYQNQIQSIQLTMGSAIDPESWKNAIVEGQSLIIRRRNEARLVGFSIYDNQSGMPVKTVGEFGVDPALFVPMLASYQSASQEIFGAGLRSTQIESGRWLCFIPGKITTTLALFTTEPAGLQLKTMQELQIVFESANKLLFEKQFIDPDSLVCPQEFFLRHTM